MSEYLIPTITAPFDVEVTLPGSKSIALRQLAMAALAHGTTTLQALPKCDDIDAMLDCLNRLGVSTDGDYEQMVVTGPMAFDTDVELNVRMSGASTRLLIGLAALRSGKTHIDGHSSLRARTNAPLFDVLSAHGCSVRSQAGHLPVTIQGRMTANDTIRVDGSLSSQYITALMVIGPYLGEHGAQIQITGDLVSRPYLNITANEMSKRGVNVTWLDEHRMSIEAGQYTPGTLMIEGDATAATYFAALATVHGSQVKLNNLGQDTQQGDYEFFDIMQRLGAQVTRTPETTTICGPTVLTALNQIDMTTMPDAALTLIAMGPLLPDGITITGLSSLHHKECDRLECPAAEFAALGVHTQTTQDSIMIPEHQGELAAHTLNTYHDHRMAMAFSVFASATAPLMVDDEGVVAKTFPHYWQAYSKLLAA